MTEPTDPAKVFALKYTVLEELAERHRKALMKIALKPVPKDVKLSRELAEEQKEIARVALNPEDE